MARDYESRNLKGKGERMRCGRKRAKVGRYNGEIRLCGPSNILIT